MQKVIYFDCETSALPESELLALMPTFEPAKNLVDQAKIAASIEKQKTAFVEKAALSPITGQILCIGLLNENGFALIAGDESEMLEAFWGRVQAVCFGTLQARSLVGWCSWHFDLPFLIKRSLKLGVPFPAGLRCNGRWHPSLVDAMVLWQMGDREAASSLDTVAKFLGLGAKSGNGADFAWLWKQDNAAAIKYVENDLKLTAAIYEKVQQL